MRHVPFDWDVCVEVMPDRNHKKKHSAVDGHVWSARFLTAIENDSKPVKDEFTSDWAPAKPWQLRNAAEAVSSLHAEKRMAERELQAELTRIRHSHANGNCFNIVWQCQEGFGKALSRSACRERGRGPERCLVGAVHIATSRMELVLNRSCTKIITLWLHPAPFNVWYSRTRRGLRMK
jgi:hypothetical protein